MHTLVALSTFALLCNHHHHPSANEFLSFELLVFPKVYTRIAHALQPENIVVVRGRLSLREDDTPKILPDDIQPIDDFLAYNDTKGEGKQYPRFEIPREALKQAKAFVKFFQGPILVEFYDQNNRSTLLLRAGIQNSEKVLQTLKRFCETMQTTS